MIAIPDFTAGAMENWGLIIYRERSMLYEEGVSSENNLQYVNTVIAHELAHMVHIISSFENCALKMCLVIITISNGAKRRPKRKRYKTKCDFCLLSIIICTIYRNFGKYKQVISRTQHVSCRMVQRIFTNLQTYYISLFLFCRKYSLLHF